MSNQNIDGEELIAKVPYDLIPVFREHLRVVIRYPWVVGIPVPDIFLENLEELEKFKEDFEIMLVPRSHQR